MGRIYRPTYTKAGPGGTRVRVQVKAWYAEYTDADGKQRQEKGFTDKGATLQLLAKREREAAQVKMGIVPAAAPNLARPLAALVKDYLDLKAADQLSDGHLRNLRDYLPEVFQKCHWHTVRDLDADQLRKWMGQKRRSCSPATVNGYLAAVKAFAKWAAAKCGLPVSPLAAVSKFNEEVDRRRSRRIPTPDELAALLAATAIAPRRHGVLVSGPDRAVLYRVAAFTGLRASELASLTRESFALESHPTVTIQAKYAKGKRTEEVPLPRHLVAELRPWLAERKPGVRLWRGDWAKNRGQADWLRRDVKRAGIAERDAAGDRLTFHGLRAYFITVCIEAGATVAELKQLARHRSINTTITHYARVRPESLHGIADRLPNPADSFSNPSVKLRPEVRNNAQNSEAPSTRSGVRKAAQK